MNRAVLWNPGPRGAEALKRWAPVLLASVAILGLGLGGDGMREWGRFEQDGIAAGELWRLVTAHLVHLSWGHLWLNLIALLVMASLFDDAMEAGDWVLAGLLSAGAIDLGLVLFHGDLDWYVGLSGVLHGLMVVGGFGLLRSTPPVGYILLAGLAAKLIWEQFSGPLPFSESTTGGPVLVDAHFYGTVGGAGAQAIKMAVRRLKR